MRNRKKSSNRLRNHRILIRKFGILVFSFCLLAALSISLGVSVKAEDHTDPRPIPRSFTTESTSAVGRGKLTLNRWRKAAFPSSISAPPMEIRKIKILEPTREAPWIMV